MLATIRNKTSVEKIKMRAPYSTYCSVGKRPFSGIVEFEYTPRDVLLDFTSFDDWLEKDIRSARMTVEELCDRVFEMLHDSLQPESLAVDVFAHTLSHSPVSVHREENFK